MKSVWIGLEGATLSAADIRRLQRPQVSGVVLFERNALKSRELLALTSEIRALRPELAIAVDQEGGRVQRLQCGGFSPLPAMAELGEMWLWEPDAALERARELGSTIGAELAAHGITVVFAPVVDLVDLGAASMIGDRSLGADPVAVTTLALALAEAIAAQGVMPVLKHFPGHGRVKADPHTEEVVLDDRPFESLWHADLVPYRIAAQLGVKAGVMLAWVRYPGCGVKEPAGLSRFWIQSVLREKLIWRGLVISDDLGMRAARSQGMALTEAVQAFWEAGGDVALICHEFEAIDALLGL